MKQKLPARHFHATLFIEITEKHKPALLAVFKIGNYDSIRIISHEKNLCILKEF
jgi:hypothetical protein